MYFCVCELVCDCDRGLLREGDGTGIGIGTGTVDANDVVVVDVDVDVDDVVFLPILLPGTGTVTPL